MALHYKLQYSFHPAGQGLFASGHIGIQHGGSFTWIYDCGSLNKTKNLLSYIDNFGHEFFKRPLDLLVISHFHFDHFSGVPHLLDKYGATTVMLPYLSEELRISCVIKAIDEYDSPLDVGEIDGYPIVDFIKFCKSPSEYFAEKGVKSILLVPARTEKNSAESEGREEELLPSEDDVELNFKSTEKKITGSCTTYTIDPIVPVTVSRRGNAFFEFLPYCDKAMLKTPFSSSDLNTLHTIVDTLEGHISTGTTLSETQIRTDCNNAKAIYAKYLNDLNDGSLVLYAGPLNPSEVYCFGNSRGCGALRGGIRRFFIPLELCCDCVMMDCRFEQNFSGILYTGDANFKNTKNFYDMEQAIIRPGTTSCWNHLACFQVMHHGSGCSYHNGIASKIKPAFSIFCADPEYKKFGHPSDVVLRDFVSYNPILVNDRGFYFCFECVGDI